VTNAAFHVAGSGRPLENLARYGRAFTPPELPAQVRIRIVWVSLACQHQPNCDRLQPYRLNRQRRCAIFAAATAACRLSATCVLSISRQSNALPRKRHHIRGRACARCRVSESRPCHDRPADRPERQRDALIPAAFLQANKPAHHQGAVRTAKWIAPR